MGAWPPHVVWIAECPAVPPPGRDDLSPAAATAGQSLLDDSKTLLTSGNWEVDVPFSKELFGEPRMIPIMFQLSLRTIGGNAITQGVSSLSNVNNLLPGLNR